MRKGLVMKNIKIVILLVMFYTAITASASGYVEWIRPFSGPGNQDVSNAIAVDGELNSVVTGKYYSGANDNYDILTVKYDQYGEALWSAQFDGPAEDYDVAWDIGIGNSGDIFVAGASDSIGGEGDIILIKYSSNGTRQWVRRFTHDVYLGHDYAKSLDIDESGNVYVTGRVRDPNAGFDGILLKYSTDGELLWSRQSDSGGSGDLGVDVAVGSDGDIRWLYQYGADFVVSCYSPEGDSLWARLFNIDTNDSPVALDVDASDNTYFISTALGNFFDWVTGKVSPEGDSLWVEIYDGPGYSYDVPDDISVSPSGNIYVTGITQNPNDNWDIGTAKYDTDGNLQWFKTYDGLLNEDDRGVDVEYHTAGGCVVTGYGENRPFRGSDIITIKYGDAGVEEWLEVWDDPYSLNNEPTDMAIDAQGEILITGKDPYDYVTIKYRSNYYVDVEVIMTPETQPIEMPSEKDSFYFEGGLRNNSPSSQTVDLRVMLMLPDSSTYGPLLSYDNISVNPEQFIRMSTIYQTVPAFAPAGEYNYVAYINDNNDDLLDSTYFFFTKSGSGNRSDSFEWFSTGWLENGLVTDTYDKIVTDEYVSGNYPNPFNPVTTISYNILDPGKVTLEVYNLLGEKVDVLIDGHQEAGLGSVEWNAGNFASGVYFYRLETKSGIYTKRMTLLK
ncbi:MAG: T9SS type A sorting domain-containing protein [candidate division Zixibacteria bacterium]|nr:T9SS type A sorting domain-containing protein [candidate division Zixibacteria bacterium]